MTITMASAAPTKAHTVIKLDQTASCDTWMTRRDLVRDPQFVAIVDRLLDAAENIAATIASMGVEAPVRLDCPAGDLVNAYLSCAPPTAAAEAFSEFLDWDVFWTLERTEGGASRQLPEDVTIYNLPIAVEVISEHIQELLDQA